MSSLAVIRDTSPSRHYRHVDVRSVVEELRRQSPRAGVDRLAEALAERIEEDRRLLLDASRVLVRQIVSTAKIAHTRRQQNGRTPEERATRRIAAKAEVKAIAAKARAICVLDTVVTLLSGESKQLRYCLGAELIALGGAYVRLGERVGPNVMTGEACTSVEAAALLMGGT